MNPRHGIFVLHYFFIEYSLAYFLKCHAAYRNCFSGFFFYVHTAYSFCSHQKNDNFGAISVTERNRVDLESGAAVQRAFLLGRIETRLFRNVPRDRERIEAAAFVS